MRPLTWGSAPAGRRGPSLLTGSGVGQSVGNFLSAALAIIYRGSPFSLFETCIVDVERWLCG